ncbi:MAG: PQQ-dependent sugar dehydrogenase [Bacteroidota bacterium]
MLRILTLLLLTPLLLASCGQADTSNTDTAKATAVKDEKADDKPAIQLDKIKLPKGFQIELYAEKVDNARSISLSPSGTLFVGTRNKGHLYALRDTDGDYKVDKNYTLAKKLDMPNGVAFKDGSLYVAEISTILRYDDIENQLDNPPKATVVYDEYPKARHHGWKYIAFGPDGKLYVPVGAPCNICESKEEIFNSITRINPDGSGFEIVQEGVRNTVGFTWHPDNNELWFTDNGRDWMGDDMPACELNHAPKDYMHFGYPYCHQGDTPDPDYGYKHPCSDFTPPSQKMMPHSAPLGLEFCPSGNFPESYTKQILVAEHGSWNRSKKSGYRIMMIKLEGDKVLSYETFAEGWLDREADKFWGRPVDLEFLPDGSLLVSDDYADAIYRISYQG